MLKDLHLKSMKPIFADILSQYADLKKQTILDQSDFKTFNEKLLALSYLLHGPLKKEFFDFVPVESSYISLLASGKKALDQGFHFEINDQAQLVVTTPEKKSFKTQMMHPELLAEEICQDELNENQKKLLELFCANLEEYPMLLFSFRLLEFESDQSI